MGRVAVRAGGKFEGAHCRSPPPPSIHPSSPLPSHAPRRGAPLPQPPPDVRHPLPAAAAAASTNVAAAAAAGAAAAATAAADAATVPAAASSTARPHRHGGRRGCARRPLPPPPTLIPQTPSGCRRARPVMPRGEAVPAGSRALVGGPGRADGKEEGGGGGSGGWGAAPPFPPPRVAAAVLQGHGAWQRPRLHARSPPSPSAGGAAPPPRLVSSGFRIPDGLPATRGRVPATAAACGPPQNATPWHGQVVEWPGGWGGGGAGRVAAGGGARAGAYWHRGGLGEGWGRAGEGLRRRKLGRGGTRPSGTTPRCRATPRPPPSPQPSSTWATGAAART